MAGARRETIKLAPVVRALRARPGLKIPFVTAGVPRNRLAALATLFGLKPDTAIEAPDDLEAARRQLVPLIRDERPDLLLVHGRSAIALAAALAAVDAGSAVAHVEAGLALDGLRDANALAIGRLATLNFAPTGSARERLLAQGATPAGIHVTGSSGVDALHMMIERLESDAGFAAAATLAPAGDGPLVLVTAERGETPLAAVTAVVQAMVMETEARFLFVTDPAQHERLNIVFEGTPRVRIAGRLDYPAFVEAMRHAQVILTDSSGIEEVAPSIGVPVLVMRNSTDRPEGVAAGSAALVGSSATAIAAAATRLLANPAAHAAMANVRSPYGDGLAAWRIAAIIREWIGA
ncbi:non-hydrolyzing UDP-N-acetylglucosamine 2-epimerase [Sphingoaurantiacus capsulatus]|uniref:UDP-N-acetylglucosamine 2-epimerase (non-hydrolyzing) n=1 Tax=Sphingoaurantiacus capsulatus TaxID=1771310 RepID=A0ABV7XAQ6_9SPHN